MKTNKANSWKYLHMVGLNVEEEDWSMFSVLSESRHHMSVYIQSTLTSLSIHHLSDTLLCLRVNTNKLHVVSTQWDVNIIIDKIISLQ